jgi:RNA polymerase sigma factor (sigma-70 family)
VYRIARNLLTDHYRAASRRPTVSLDGEDIRDPHEVAGDSGHLDSLALRMTLKTLPDRDQDVLTLRLAGLSNREIGAVLELSEAAAGMAFLRALRRLREKVEA